MIMLDAQSRGNMYRQMPRLMRLLHGNEGKDVMIFKKHGIHGDGTTSQLMAAFAPRRHHELLKAIEYLVDEGFIELKEERLTWVKK